ncbi:MAG: flagellar hook-associated protein FlgK [Fibromonadaceae bacterium]|jgi:flagellar hook-associated protein 1 FlgK|nr:flagellar hook-associated protein FlgK [Fibromonadaceae bacterium]
MSLFEGLNIATRGLSASQLGINVTGQNITNAGTEGYSRKRIEQSADWRRDGSYGQMGFGVEVYSINRVRDQFIDRLVNEESTRYGHYAIKDSAYARIEDIFNEPSNHALNSLLNDFWNGWDDVSKNPESAGARETLRSTSESLVTQFHYLTTQLRSYKDTINDEIEARVNKINEITAGIYRCNMAIAAAENTIGNKANDTRDQRDLLLQQLSQIIDVDYFEDDNGILILSSNGQMLVSQAKNHELIMSRQEFVEEDGYRFSKVEVRLDLTGNAFIPKQGEMRALMDVRDEDIPRYEGYLNNLAKTLITEVNKIHQTGYALSGLSYIDFFNGEAENFSAANIKLGQAIKADINNIAAGIGGKIINVDSKSITEADYPKALTISYGTVPAQATQLKLQNLDPPTTADGAPYPQFRHICKGSLTIEINGEALQEGLDYYVDYQNAEITFNDKDGRIAEAAKLGTLKLSFDYNTTGYAGPGDGDNALLLSQLRNSLVIQGDVFGKSTQTINQYYSGMLGRLGTERNDAGAGLNTRAFALQQLMVRQNEVMGVNLDEEIASLIQYQHTYQASARFLTTINTMLETLLNM